MSSSDDETWGLSPEEEQQRGRDIALRGCATSSVVVAVAGTIIVVGLLLLALWIATPIFDELSESAPPVGKILNGFEGLLDEAAPESAAIVASDRHDSCTPGTSDNGNVSRRYTVSQTPEATYENYERVLASHGWRILRSEQFNEGLTTRKRFGDLLATTFVIQRGTNLEATAEISCTRIKNE